MKRKMKCAKDSGNDLNSSGALLGLSMAYYTRKFVSSSAGNRKTIAL